MWTLIKKKGMNSYGRRSRTTLSPWLELNVNTWQLLLLAIADSCTEAAPNTYLLSLVSFAQLGNVCTSLGIFCTKLTRGGGGAGGQGRATKRYLGEYPTPKTTKGS